jgi:hypothetical protein
VGNYNTLDTQFMYNSPLSDALAVRHVGCHVLARRLFEQRRQRARLSIRSFQAALHANGCTISILVAAEITHNDSSPPGSVLSFGTTCCTADSPHGAANPWYDPAPGGNYWRTNYQRYWANVEYDLGWARLSILPSAQSFFIEWRKQLRTRQ